MQPPSDDSEASQQAAEHPPSSATEDPEVADWVKEQLALRGESPEGDDKPALHAVPLDAVPGSPLLDDPATMTLPA